MSSTYKGGPGRKDPAALDNNTIESSCINYDGALNLAEAIVVQAARDYCIVLNQLKFNKDDESAECEKDKIERFFHSSWYNLLTNVNADYILKRIQQNVNRRMKSDDYM